MTDQATSAPAAGSSQLNETVSAAHARLHKTFQSGKTLPLSWRRSQLQALGRFVNTHESDILSALYNDLHRPPNESLSFSLLQLRADIHHLMNNLTRLTKPKPMGRHFLAPGYQVPSPKGAVAILAPSNFPIFLACRPLAAAFAAGNTALLKLSEFAPASEKFLLKLRDVLDADAFAVFTGEAQVSKEIVSLPWDHLFFTGSPNVGKVIMAAAAKHLTPVTLELGGKNPAFILGDADLKSAARSIVRSRYYNSGQVCIATVCFSKTTTLYYYYYLFLNFCVVLTS